MKKLLLPLSLVLAQMLAVTAFAQTKGGEADPEQAKGQTLPKATPAEKATAKAARKAEGADVADKANTRRPGEETGAGAAKVATKQERAAARAKRKAAAAAAVKKGEIASGEK
jgi:hypothetical protein